MKFNRLTIILLLTAILSGLSLTAQPSGYYNSAAGLSGTALQQALHTIISNHNQLSYSDLWTAFESTDKKANGKVWDIYSDIPGGTPPYEFTFGSDQCGSYNSENDCYNREHSFPASWFGDNYPMYSDLFQLYPTDGYVNNRRSNYPYGKVNTSEWTSLNGSKLGSCETAGYSGTVFEPIDGYKGDLARTYFYMATRYLGEDSGWPGSGMVNGSQPKAWAKTMLVAWHLMDPVSQKEKDRNEAIYALQQNRNPYIDNPEWVNAIWGTNAGIDDVQTVVVKAYPNPASTQCTLTLPVVPGNRVPETLVYDLAGTVVKVESEYSGDEVRVSLAGVPSGLYFISVRIAGEDVVYHAKVIRL